MIEMVDMCVNGGVLRLPHLFSCVGVWICEVYGTAFGSRSVGRRDEDADVVDVKAELLLRSLCTVHALVGDGVMGDVVRYEDGCAAKRC